MVTMPVEKGFFVTSKFGPRWGSQHWGTDFGRVGGSGGFPVFAVKDGTVTRAGRADGFGFWITVDHPASNGGGETVYGHVIPEVVAGQKVAEGQRIGRIHPTKGPDNGWVDPHLHLEWHRYSWVPPGPDRLDPEQMLAHARWPGEAPPVSGLTPEILADVMGCSLERARQMFPGYVQAMNAAGITTVRRAAMFAAQIGHESAGLLYMEEIASGAAYEGRSDLGNVHPGDGPRYKGSGPIQLTGRANFRAFTQWANSEGHTDIDFEASPELVRQDPRWGFLAASWYWTQARPQINSLADAGDVVGVTRAINGGTNGLADRQARYDRALAFGDRLLPPKGGLMITEERLRQIVREEIAGYCWAIGHDVKRMAIQLGLDADDAGYAGVPGWEQGGHRSIYDLLSAVASKVKVPRTKDTLPEAPKNPRNPKLGGEK